MANIKSAKKRVRTSEESRLQNQAFKADMRTHIKRVESFVDSKEAENANSALHTAVQKIDKAVQKGIVHQNNGDRQKSRLAKKVNSLSA